MPDHPTSLPQTGAAARRWAMALLLAAQRVSIGQAALDLGLCDLSEAMDLLAGLQGKGALLGFVTA